MTSSASATQFAIFRIAMGLFLVSHFLWLLPYGGEIYGPTGMYSSTLPTPFPNALEWAQSAEQAQAFIGALAVLATLFLIGCGRRYASLLLWYGWACLTNQTPLLYVPSEGLVGWLLLLCAAIPSGERWTLWPHPSPDWKIPKGAIQAAWIVLGVGYLASGIDKLASPSWHEGSAIRTVLTSPMAYWDLIAREMSKLPGHVIHAMSWSVLALEVGFFWLIWSRRTRPIAWTVMTAMHLGIRATLDLHTVTDPFLIAQILIFDPAWLGNRRTCVHTKEWGSSTLSDSVVTPLP